MENPKYIPVLKDHPVGDYDFVVLAFPSKPKTEAAEKAATWFVPSMFSSRAEADIQLKEDETR